jgi:antitoxin HicB
LRVAVSTLASVEILAMAESLIRIHIEHLPENVYLATSEDLPGLVAQGRTVAETMEIAQDVARKLIESYLDHGDPLPPTLRPPDSRIDLSLPISSR